MEHVAPQKLPKSPAASSPSSRSHSRSPGKVRSPPPPESKRKKSSGGSGSGRSSKLAPLPKYGSSYSWDSAQGQAFVDKIVHRAQSAADLKRIDHGSLREKKDAPYLALVQLFNQFQGMPIDTRKILVNVSVMGSTGPLRMLVTSDATVKEVIKMTLLRYAHEGRIPSLGRSSRDYDLYDSQYSSQALKHEDRITDFKTRNFVLCPGSPARTTCGGDSNSTSSSSKSWWSYVTSIKSLV